MAYLEQERAIATATGLQASVLQDIAESLKILSGRSTLKENRLREEIDKLERKKQYIDEWGPIDKKIDALMDEIYQDRLKREEMEVRK